MSVVFHLVVGTSPDDVVGRSSRAPSRVSVRGADWRHPEGPRFNLDRPGGRPVVHLSWTDAQASCRRAGRRCRRRRDGNARPEVGSSATRYPWGDELPRVLRGRSPMCRDSYCNRYRNAAHPSNRPDPSMDNAGFHTITR